MKSSIDKKRIQTIELSGIPVSDGIASGRAVLYNQEIYNITKTFIKKNKKKDEVQRLRLALEKTKNELFAIQQDILVKLDKGKADFFNVHLLIIEDEILIKSIEALITNNLQSAEWSVYEIIDKEVKKMLAIEDPYLKERVADLYDVGKRILKHLLNKNDTVMHRLYKNSILIAHDLTPSQTATLDFSKIKGIVTEVGGKTSHTAILARSLGIPAVVGVSYALSKSMEGDTVVVDANTGKVVFNPDKSTLKLYSTAAHVYEVWKHELEKIAHLESVTKDNIKIHVAGNIEISEEVDTVLKHGAQGIGLYRTEFLYLNRKDFPTEEELFENAKDVVEKIAPESVIFRTIDLGGDKMNKSFIDSQNESNPFLGWRAIRYCLENPAVFKTQLRALLRASAFGKAKIMIPMISDVSEIIQTKNIIEQLKQELDEKNIAYDKNIEIGSMIEIPSAALTASTIAKEVDFFSVGSNDLVQYTLAVDRTNSKIAHLFDPFNPGVLILLQKIVDSAKKNNIDAHICGELGSDPLAIPLLIGMGYRHLSVGPSSVPEVKKIIRNLTIDEAENIAKSVKKMTSSAEIYRYLKSELLRIAPEIINNRVS